MTQDRVLQTMAKHEERLNAHDKRIERNENLTVQIHKLTSGVENLTREVKNQNDRMEKIVLGFDERMKNQGKRIGELEKKGGKKLESIIATVITVVITAIVMYFANNMGF